MILKMSGLAQNNMNKIIKTKDLNNFCGGCNNTVELHRFVQVDEGEPIESAWERRHENENDELFKHTRFMGFCLCGNIYIHE